MPTTKRRYTFTDTGRLQELLDTAQERWPGISDRKALLLRLAEEGLDTLEADSEQLATEERRARARAALTRIPSLIDRELLLSDRAWS